MDKASEIRINDLFIEAINTLSYYELEQLKTKLELECEHILYEKYRFEDELETFDEITEDED